MAALTRTFFVFVAALLFGSVASAQVTIYTCGPDFRPTDLTFTADGRIYSASPTFQSSFDQHIYRLGRSPRSHGGAVYMFDDAQTCKRLAAPFSRAFGVVALNSDLVCTNANLLSISGAPYGPSSAATVACWNGRVWEPAKVAVRSESVGNDLLAEGERVWLATWQAPSRGLGKVSLLPTGRGLSLLGVPLTTPQIRRQLPVGNTAIPHFVSRFPGGDLALTAFTAEPATSAVVVSRVLRQTASGPQQIFSRRSLLSGIEVANGSVWVADYYEGELLELSLSGEVRGTHRGFEGPMGLALAPNGDICVAEILAGRLRCFPVGVLRGL